MVNPPKRYHTDAAYAVTSRAFRTRNRTFMLQYVEKTQLRRPALVLAIALTAALYGFSYTFADLIYPREFPWLLVPPVGALLIASQIGALFLRSRALGQEGAVIGWHRHLRKIRTAIDDALEDRAESEGVGPLLQDGEG